MAFVTYLEVGIFQHLVYYNLLHLQHLKQILSPILRLIFRICMCNMTFNTFAGALIHLWGLVYI